MSTSATSTSTSGRESDGKRTNTDGAAGKRESARRNPSPWTRLRPGRTARHPPLRLYGGRAGRRHSPHSRIADGPARFIGWGAAAGAGQTFVAAPATVPRRRRNGFLLAWKASPRVGAGGAGPAALPTAFPEGAASSVGGNLTVPVGSCYRAGVGRGEALEVAVTEPPVARRAEPRPQTSTWRD
jgi:hypothetical protein